MIGIIVAYDKNYGIGNKGRIPWKIPGEQKRFRSLTMGNAVVMGRRTYEEIGRPLPGRLNIVVSSTQNFTGENLITVPTLEKAIEAAAGRDVFISGGRGLYRVAMDIADVMYITEVEGVFEADTFFPQFDEKMWNKTVEEEFCGEIPYRYVTYTRKTE